MIRSNQNLALPVSNGLFKSAPKSWATFFQHLKFRGSKTFFIRQFLIQDQHWQECKRSDMERWIDRRRWLTAWSVHFLECDQDLVTPLTNYHLHNLRHWPLFWFFWTPTLLQSIFAAIAFLIGITVSIEWWHRQSLKGSYPSYHI